MAVKRKGNTYFFRVLIRRGVTHVTREGGVCAIDPSGAMDEIEAMASEEWNCPIVNAHIYEVTKDGEMGELVLQTKDLPARDNVVELRPHKKLPAPAMKPSESYKKDDDVLELWEMGDYYNAKSNFAVFKPKEVSK